MAKDQFITPNPKAEPANSLLCGVALQFRHALDLYFTALQADWHYCAGRSKAAPAATAILAHAAASAWANCTQALYELRDMSGAHPDTRCAAGYLLHSVPEQTPTESSLDRLGRQLLQIARGHRKTQPGLSALLEEASTLLMVHSANMVVISMHPRGADRLS